MDANKLDALIRGRGIDNEELATSVYPTMEVIPVKPWELYSSFLGWWKISGWRAIGAELHVRIPVR